MDTAIIVLGGGPAPSLTVPLPFVLPRYEAAYTFYRNHPSFTKIICVSAGTAHVPPLTSCDYPVFESTVCANFFTSKGVPPSDVIIDSFSYDTIGNAHYANNVVESLGLGKAIVVTSKFHMERSKEIFDWVWSLKSPEKLNSLSYQTVEDVGLSGPDLSSRISKESSGLAGVKRVKQIVSERYNNNLDAWLLTDHDLYSAEGLVKRAEGGCDYCQGLYGGMTSYGGGSGGCGSRNSSLEMVVFGVLIGLCLSEFWRRRKTNRRRTNLR
ncbi:hypothetical protein TrVE_jg4326 [Triparma verrucosa]|uniref:DUF218 domain-containing protein n=1 Tax=Triparma verrucosa TaxID=1606542 RepID=A0A9W7F141_9STRA|nr:hypothetical protein TrVE_jg4326 [Triparma verrucosa]